jgi:hypothetical protein
MATIGFATCRIGANAIDATAIRIAGTTSLNDGDLWAMVGCTMVRSVALKLWLLTTVTRFPDRMGKQA